MDGEPVVRKRIVIEYDFIEQAVHIGDNDFTAVVAFGVLEAAKSMIAEDWHAKDR